MGYTRILIILTIFQAFYLTLGDSLTKSIHSRQNSLSTCARECYASALANSSASGSCSQTDNLCLCRRDEFSDNVKDCWDKCTDIEEAAAKTWFKTECAARGVAVTFKNVTSAVSGAASSVANTITNARNSQPKTVPIPVTLALCSVVLYALLGLSEVLS